MSYLNYRISLTVGEIKMMKSYDEYVSIYKKRNLMKFKIGDRVMITKKRYLRGVYEINRPNHPLYNKFNRYAINYYNKIQIVENISGSSIKLEDIPGYWSDISLEFYRPCNDLPDELFEL